MYFVWIVVLAVVLPSSEGGTTTFTPPHVSHGVIQPVGHTFSFNYERATHHMILNQGRFCYITKLTSTELAQIHTDHGLMNVEISILNALNTSIAIPLSDVSHYDIKHCGTNHEKYFLLHV